MSTPIDVLKKQIEEDNERRYGNYKEIYIFGRKRQEDGTMTYDIRNRNNSLFKRTLIVEELYSYIVSDALGSLLNEQRQVAVGWS